MGNEEMEKEFAAHDAEAKAKFHALEHRVSNLEKNQDVLYELAASVKLLAQRQTNLENDIAEIKGDVKTLADKPGKRWESVVEKLILVAVGAVAAYILGKIGL